MLVRHVLVVPEQLIGSSVTESQGCPL